MIAWSVFWVLKLLHVELRSPTNQIKIYIFFYLRLSYCKTDRLWLNYNRINGFKFVHNIIFDAHKFSEHIKAETEPFKTDFNPLHVAALTCHRLVMQTGS